MERADALAETKFDLSEQYPVLLELYPVLSELYPVLSELYPVLSELYPVLSELYPDLPGYFSLPATVAPTEQECRSL